MAVAVAAAAAVAAAGAAAVAAAAAAAAAVSLASMLDSDWGLVTPLVQHWNTRLSGVVLLPLHEAAF